MISDAATDLIKMRTGSGNGIDITTGEAIEVFQDGASIALEDHIVVGLCIGPTDGGDGRVHPTDDIHRWSRNDGRGTGIDAVVVVDPGA